MLRTEQKITLGAGLHVRGDPANISTLVHRNNYAEWLFVISLKINSSDITHSPFKHLMGGGGKGEGSTSTCIKENFRSMNEHRLKPQKSKKNQQNIFEKYQKLTRDIFEKIKLTFLSKKIDLDQRDVVAQGPGNSVHSPFGSF